MKKFIPLIILVIFIILISLAIYNLSKKQSDNATSSNEIFSETNDDNDNDGEDDSSVVDFEKIDVPLPDFEIPDLFDAKQKFTQKDLIGKYTIINFFASWCSTCRMEHEMLLKMQQEGIADLYGVAWRDIDKNTIKFLQESGNPFVKVGADNKGIFSKILDIEAVPETWLVNPQGRVVLRLEGNIQDFSIEDIRRYIKAH